MKFISTIHFTIVSTILLSSFIQFSKAQHWSRGFNPLGKRSADNWFKLGSKTAKINPETSNSFYENHKVKVVRTPETQQKIYDLLQMLSGMDGIERRVFQKFLERELGMDFDEIESRSNVKKEKTTLGLLKRFMR